LPLKKTADSQIIKKFANLRFFVLDKILGNYQIGFSGEDIISWPILMILELQEG
jgi:hypothetical protein